MLKVASDEKRGETVPAIPCGLVVRIRRFHRRGRGSIPRMGVHFFSLLLDAILRNPGSRNGQTFRISLRIKIGGGGGF